MADLRRISDRYTKLALEVLEENKELNYIKEMEITIVYLASDQEKKSKGKVVLGQCEKVADKYKWGIPCDFTITLFDPNLTYLTEEQIKRVIFHELLHVGVSSRGLYVKPHDLEDFKLIIDKFGTDWAQPQIPFTEN